MDVSLCNVYPGLCNSKDAASYGKRFSFEDFNQSQLYSSTQALFNVAFQVTLQEQDHSSGGPVGH